MAFIEELSAVCKRSHAQELSSSIESPLNREILFQAARPGNTAARPPLRPSVVVENRPATSQHSGVVPVETDASRAAAQALAPMIIVGLGGSAAQILQQLQQRLKDRLPESVLPAFKLLLIDSNPETIQELHRQHPDDQTLVSLTTPLHSSAEYRTNSQKHRRWMSRRWLFNVPRNLQTSGLRPFGRLALLTHAARVKSTLQMLIRQVSSQQGLQLGKQPIGGPPRIVLVSSLSGGTGSGMVLDLAYAARVELQMAGYDQPTVDAVLLHSTPVGTERDKAVLNALATLRELAHYSKLGKYYPGEPLLDLPSFHGNNRTFRQVHLMDCGENLDTNTWKLQLDNAAEYLFLRMTTPRDGYLNHDQSASSSADSVYGVASQFSTIQVRQVGVTTHRFLHDFSRQLCADVIQSWRGPAQPPQGARSSQHQTQVMQTFLLHDDSSHGKHWSDQAPKRVQEFGVELPQLVAKAREMLRQELTTSEQQFLRAIFQQARKSPEGNVLPPHELANHVLNLQDRAIGLDFGERPAERGQNTLFDLLHSRLASQGMQLAVKFTTWVHSLVDDPNTGVEGACQAAEAGRRFLRELSGTVAKEIQTLHKQQIETRIKLTSSPPEPAGTRGSMWWSLRRTAAPDQQDFRLLENLLLDQGQACLEELVLVCIRMQLQSIEAQASAVIDRLLCFEQDLRQLEKRFASQPLDPGEAANATEEALQQLLIEHRSRLNKEFRRQIELELLSGPRKIQRFLTPGTSLEQQVAEPLQRNARKIVLNSMRQVLLVLLQHDEQISQDAALNLDTVLADCLQEPLALGRAEREQVIVAVPTDAAARQLENRLTEAGQSVSVCAAPTNSLTICRESSVASLYDAVLTISRQQQALIKLSENLASRVDVAWDPLAPATEDEPSGERAPQLNSAEPFPDTMFVPAEASQPD